MSKSTQTYWNTLAEINASKWEVIPESEGMLSRLTLSMDKESGDYTRLTKFKKGANTKALGGKSHEYPEEIYIISGRIYDEAFGIYLEAGHFASRPPGEVHGPFKCEEECLVLEISFPSQAVDLERN
jgi:hypothetical protein